jgi:hypothetical protein
MTGYVSALTSSFFVRSVREYLVNLLHDNQRLEESFHYVRFKGFQ